MTRPAVSVLVTVYNREKLVPETVKSILDSSYEDFEIILVDDASSDHSWDVIRQLAESDDRISAHRNETNLGDYGNRAKAISLSKTDLIKFVDADDLIYPHSLELMVRAMAEAPDAALALSQSSAELDRPYPFALSPLEAYQRQFLGCGCLNCGPSGAIFRREAFEQVGGFRDWGVLNDTDLWLRLAAKWPVVLLPPALVWWRRHEGQEFERGQASGEYLAKGFALSREALSSPDCPLNEEDCRVALKRSKQHHARRILALATKGRSPGDALRLGRMSRLTFTEWFAGIRPYM